METFDLIVIGSGSGLSVASALAERGENVAVVEKGMLGGTCLNHGCIPSKMLIHHADLAEEIRSSDKFHIEADIGEIGFKEIVEEVNEDVTQDSESIERGLKASESHTLYQGTAKFVDEKVLEVNGEKITSEKIVVAAGSRPLIPPVDGLEDVEYLTSKEALKLNERPESMVIVGGGYISLELAHFFDAMGTEVTILEMSDNLVSREDRDVSKRITKIAKDRYDVNLNSSAEKVYEKDGRIHVTAEIKGEEEEFVADKLLVATGRRPNIDLLEVEKAGLETDERGFLVTDETMETNKEGVYALGDIAGNWMFKHSANYEAEIVFRNLVSEDEEFKADFTAMPHAVFTRPQIAGVGMTEQELEEKGREYVKSTYSYSDTAMGAAIKDETGFVKVLASTDDGEILGCHIIGPEASVLIHEVLIAMRNGSGTVFDITETVHIHPALNEVVSRAFSQF